MIQYNRPKMVRSIIFHKLGLTWDEFTAAIEHPELLTETPAGAENIP